MLEVNTIDQVIYDSRATSLAVTVGVQGCPFMKLTFAFNEHCMPTGKLVGCVGSFLEEYFGDPIVVANFNSGGITAVAVTRINEEQVRTHKVEAKRDNKNDGPMLDAFADLARDVFLPLLQETFQGVTVSEAMHEKLKAAGIAQGVAPADAEDAAAPEAGTDAGDVPTGDDNDAPEAPEAVAARAAEEAAQEHPSSISIPNGSLLPGGGKMIKDGKLVEVDVVMEDGKPADILEKGEGVLLP